MQAGQRPRKNQGAASNIRAPLTKGVPFSRKTARKQAREDKKQRKALNYENKKMTEKVQKKQEWLQRHPHVLKQMQEAKKSSAAVANKRTLELRKEEDQKRIPIKKRRINLQPAFFTTDVSEDPLLAFAERALEEGILGSDGEFDEAKMNSLFANEGEEEVDGSDDDEISVGSADEQYLLGQAPIDDEDIDVESDSQLSEKASSEAGEPESSDIDVENDSEASEKEDITPDKNQRQDTLNHTPKAADARLTSAESETVKMLQRNIQGHVNRLTMSNFDSIAAGIADLYRNNPRHHVTEALSSSILASITKQPNLLDSFILNYAALVAALVHLIGVDFVAIILEKCVPILDKNKEGVDNLMRPEGAEESENNISPAKIAMNAITLLSYLYDLQMISSLVIVDIMDEALAGLNELDVEILVKLVRNCGAQLRRDDAAALKDIVSKITARISTVPVAQQSSRFKFMVETILDLKNNRQKLVAVQHGELDSIKKIIRNILLQNNIPKQEALNVSLSDIRNIKSKGSWWKIGAAWNPEGEKDSGDQNKRALTLGKEQPSNGATAKLLELARKQGMNTDIRRSIFVTLLSSEDYLDAFQRLVALKLTGKQEKEIAFVLLHCCLYEKNYNPFYALVAGKFAESRHNFVITFKYALWDRLKDLSAEDQDDEDISKSLRESIHAGKFFGFLFGKRSLSLSFLKRASFTRLSEGAVVFMQVLLVSIIEAASDDVELASMFEDIAKIADGRKLKRRHRHDDDHQNDNGDDLFGPDFGERVAAENDKDQGALEKQELEALQVGLRLFIRQYFSAQSASSKHLSSFIADPRLFHRRLEIAINSLE